MQRPKINKTNELKVISEHRFEKLFSNSSGFDAMKVPQEHDYGIDYIVRLIDTDKNILSECFICQLKSTKKITVKEKMIKFHNFPVKTLNLLREDALPSYIFLYNHSKGEMYYEKVEAIYEILNKKNNNWSQQKTATIYFLCDNLVNEEKINSIYAETQRICQQINKTRPILDAVSILSKYANIDVKISEKERNINILSAKKGFGINVQLKSEDARKLQESFMEGKPFVSYIKNGKAQFTFNNKPLYELRNFVKIEMNPQKGRRKIKFKIPNNGYEIGPFDFIVSKRMSTIIAETDKISLPWQFNFKLDKDKKKADFHFKFYPEFSNNEQFLKYLEFMKNLESSRKFDFIDMLSEKKVFNINVESTPVIENWLIEFVRNINIIEHHTNKTFDLNNEVNKKEIEQAFIYAKLITEGRFYPETNKVNLWMIGSEIKRQAKQLLSKGELKCDGKYDGILCGETITYDFVFCLQDAEVNLDTKKFLNIPELIEDNKEYKLEYISKEKGYMIYKSQSNITDKK